MRPLAPRMRDTGRGGGAAGGLAGYAVRDKTVSHAMMTSIRCGGAMRTGSADQDALYKQCLP